MARVKFDVNSAVIKLSKDVKNVLKKSALKEELGDAMVKRVALKARAGRPLNKNKKFPKLERSTIERRKALAKKNGTHSDYSPSRSNLTFTGQLIDAIKFVRKGAGKFELAVDKTARTKYKGAGNKRPPNNEKLDDYLRKGVKSKSGTKKFVLFDSTGLRSDKVLRRELKKILKKFLTRQLRRG